MASATDRKAQAVEAIEKSLTSGLSLARVLENDAWETEVRRVENLVIQVRIRWHQNEQARYYTVKVAEPW